MLSAALRLFNERGTAGVSTNHVAVEAGMSPGNLYYWFPNKSAIIRALFAEWRDASSVSVPETVKPDEVLNGLFAAVVRQVGVTRRFAVFARELVPLLHADPEPAAAYRDNFRDRISLLTGAVESIADAGLLARPEPPADLASLVRLTWIATEYTPSFIAAVDEPAGSPSGDDRGVSPLSVEVRIIAASLLAQLTARGRAALDIRDAG